MTPQPSRIHLFQGYGVELEYMIVDRDTLAVKPIADELLKYELGRYDSDFENGMITWSNELVLHVIELKSTRPERDMAALNVSFQENVETINTILGTWNAMLMPTGAHPFMNPQTDTRLWPHDSNDVYAMYNKIFNCHGHGWSNLQSVHINLPFYDDEEFAKLHAAVRMVLPILPGLCASTPILDGRFTGIYDTRLKYYKMNQSRIPSITGRVIPEAVFSRRNYLQVIYDRIKADLAPYDPDGLLNPIWVNSRGAIARFDRGSIEIRIMDCQESPAADLAIVVLVIETVKALAEGKLAEVEELMRWKTDHLGAVYDRVVEKAGETLIDQADYLNVFGVTEGRATVQELWTHISNRMAALPGSQLPQHKPVLDKVLKSGTLSQRVVRALDNNYSHANITRVYRQLCDCLASGTQFIA